jgi:hypothetical protein
MPQYHVKTQKGALVRTFDDQVLAEEFALTAANVFDVLNLFEVEVIKTERLISTAKAPPEEAFR